MLLAREHVPFRLPRLYALLAYTPVRPSELKVLKWPSADLDVGAIRVWEAYIARAQRHWSRTQLIHSALTPDCRWHN